MTDIRRTLLWVVFTMSLVLIWDAWNKHTGQPSIFGGGKPAVSAPAPNGANGANGTSGTNSAVPPGAVPAPAGVPAAAGTAAATLPGAAPVSGAVPASKGEQITLTTDSVKATFDSLGGSLVRLELLAYRDAMDPTRNVVLLEQSAKRSYAAQTGLITGQPGITLPNHYTQMAVVPGERMLEPGAKDISIRFESPTVDGVKLAKTYDDVREYAKGMLGKAMTTYQTAGIALPVDSVLITQATDIAQELYLSVLVDRSTQTVTFIASADGGVEIEKTAVDNPDAIKSLNVNYVQGLQPYQCRDMGFALGLNAKQVGQLTKIMLGLYKLFNEKDLALVELNPLAILTNGDLAVLDGKINSDDSATFRHPELLPSPRR